MKQKSFGLIVKRESRLHNSNANKKRGNFE